MRYFYRWKSAIKIQIADWFSYASLTNKQNQYRNFRFQKLFVTLTQALRFFSVKFKYKERKTKKKCPAYQNIPLIQSPTELEF